MMVHACNPSTQEAEVGEFQVPDQPRLLSKAQSQTIFKKPQNKNLTPCQCKVLLTACRRKKEKIFFPTNKIFSKIRVS
jgi:hypothetical protein